MCRQRALGLGFVASDAFNWCLTVRLKAHAAMVSSPTWQCPHSMKSAARCATSSLLCTSELERCRLHQHISCKTLSWLQPSGVSCFVVCPQDTAAAIMLMMLDHGGLAGLAAVAEMLTNAFSRDLQLGPAMAKVAAHNGAIIANHALLPALLHSLPRTADQLHYAHAGMRAVIAMHRAAGAWNIPLRPYRSLLWTTLACSIEECHNCSHCEGGSLPPVRRHI